MSWLMQESPGLKLDWLEEIRLLSKKCLNMSLSNILLNTGRRETGL